MNDGGEFHTNVFINCPFDDEYISLLIKMSTITITIQEIAEIREEFLGSLSLPIQWPEPHPRLDLESRSDSDERTFKHIHQSCIGHAENFRISNQIKIIGPTL